MINADDLENWTKGQWGLMSNGGDWVSFHRHFGDDREENGVTYSNHGTSEADELARYQLAPPPVVIENVMVNDQMADADGDLILPSDTKKLEMAYVSLSYRTPEQIRYRYGL